MKNLKPSRVFYYFEELMKIPRPSGYEQEVSDYLVKIGKEMGYDTYQDKNLNVIIKRKATEGYEDSPKVIIQGHMDMVAAKSDDSSHDFKKDPLIPVIDGKFLKAKDTTLGADNGIAVAMGLALLEDENYQGPQIELLITTEEETSMAGALNLEEGLLEGDYLINLDSEEEGILTVGSAGGLTIFVKEPIGKKEDKEGLLIKLSGLLGGHSGMQINENRGNAIKIIGELLEGLSDISIGEFSSGSLDNVIPSSARLFVFGVDKNLLKEKASKIIDKNSDLMGDLKIEIEESKGTIYSKELTNKLIKMMIKVPSRVNTMIKGTNIVESSDNLAFIREEDGYIVSEISLRSSEEHILGELKNKICSILDENDINYSIGSEYPGWEYKKDSKLRPLAQEIYKDMYGKDFETIVIHAGLECGAIYEKYKDLDIISIGPNITGAHSVEEKVEIDSVARVDEYVRKLLKSIK